MVTLYRFWKELDPSLNPVLATLHRLAPIGERGVDLFFVLSGFLITGILLRTKARPRYFKNFFMRRSLRIFPLYFAALAFFVGIFPLVASPSPFDTAFKEQLYLWTYLTNVRMSWLNQWCFGPLDHFWSLAVEEHFYLAWPFAVYLLSTKWLLRLSIGIIAVVGIARTICAMNPAFDVAVDVLTLFRCDSLCFGVVLAILMHQRVSIRWIEGFAKWVLPVLLVMAVTLAVVGTRALTLPSTLWPAIWAILLSLLVTRPTGHLLSRMTTNSLLRWLGKYSYGMYVVQLPLLSIVNLNWILKATSAGNNGQLVVQLCYVPMMLALSMLLGYLSYHLLEKHFLRFKQRWD